MSVDPAALIAELRAKTRARPSPGDAQHFVLSSDEIVALLDLAEDGRSVGRSVSPNSGEAVAPVAPVAQVTAIATTLRSISRTAGIYGGYLPDAWFAIAARGLLEIAHLTSHGAPTDLVRRFSVSDIEVIIAALDSDAAAVARLVERSGREFVPAHVELLEQLGTIRATFDGARRCAQARATTVTLVEGSPGSGRFA